MVLATVAHLSLVLAVLVLDWEKVELVLNRPSRQLYLEVPPSDCANRVVPA